MVGGGLGRMVDRFELIGVFTKSTADMHMNTKMGIELDSGSCGGSDELFRKRLNLAKGEEEGGGGAGGSGSGSGSGGGAIDHGQLARERLQKLNEAMSKEIPEWLKNFISILPPNRRMGAKPPVAITELVLNSLISNVLPPKPAKDGPSWEESEDFGDGGTGKKRRRDDDEDDDDFGVGNDNVGSVGDMFRKRQKSKLQ